MSSKATPAHPRPPRDPLRQPPPAPVVRVPRTSARPPAAGASPFRSHPRPVLRRQPLDALMQRSHHGAGPTFTPGLKIPGIDMLPSGLPRRTEPRMALHTPRPPDAAPGPPAPHPAPPQPRSTPEPSLEPWHFDADAYVNACMYTSWRPGLAVVGAVGPRRPAPAPLEQDRPGDVRRLRPTKPFGNRPEAGAGWDDRVVVTAAGAVSASSRSSIFAYEMYYRICSAGRVTPDPARHRFPCRVWLAGPADPLRRLCEFRSALFTGQFPGGGNRGAAIFSRELAAVCRIRFPAELLGGSREVPGTPPRLL